MKGQSGFHIRCTPLFSTVYFGLLRESRSRSKSTLAGFANTDLITLGYVRDPLKSGIIGSQFYPDSTAPLPSDDAAGL